MVQISSVLNITIYSGFLFQETENNYKRLIVVQTFIGTVEGCRSIRKNVLSLSLPMRRFGHRSVDIIPKGRGYTKNIVTIFIMVNSVVDPKDL